MSTIFKQICHRGLEIKTTMSPHISSATWFSAVNLHFVYWRIFFKIIIQSCILKLTNSSLTHISTGPCVLCRVIPILGRTLGSGCTLFHPKLLTNYHGIKAYTIHIYIMIFETLPLAVQTSISWSVCLGGTAPGCFGYLRSK